MHDIEHFTLADMSLLGAALRRRGEEAARMAECADRIVRHLYESLRTREGARSCASARFFKTHPAADLPANLQIFQPPAHSSTYAEVAGTAGAAGAASSSTNCLVLLAKVGLDPPGDDALLSSGTGAAWPMGDALRAAPSFRSLIDQFGLDISSVASPEAASVYGGEASHKACGVFRTEDVPGAIAAEGVRSILGFGGLLPSGSLFFVLLYLRSVIAQAHAAMFKPIGINVKMALLPFDGRPLFAGTPRMPEEGGCHAG
jgi:hypothetical protein